MTLPQGIGCSFDRGGDLDIGLASRHEGHYKLGEVWNCHRAHGSKSYQDLGPGATFARKL